MTFHTPPRNQGQIVTVSFATPDDGMVIQHVHDASDQTSVYYISRRLHDDQGDYWNRPPLNRRWRKMTPNDLRNYGLD